MFNINLFKNSSGKISRYNQRLDFLRKKGQYTESIEQAVSSAIKNIFQHRTRSFVIYGEPQSGKTEMMIALTARLLDEGFKIIIVLLNDNVQLLSQNLERFSRSDINPSPKNFNEVIDASIHISNNEWIIFCKKNSKDLQKLIAKFDGIDRKVIIDDEADYATPNSKINKGEKTRINELVESLLAESGIYIGVTATPARLDLNNTFENQNDKWIDFPPHPFYTGQNIFFPTEFNQIETPPYHLNLLPNEGDDPKYLREALFNFFVNVAFLNLSETTVENYCMLVHTSGKKADHTEDYKQVIKVFDVLKDPKNKYFESYVKKIWEISKDLYDGKENSITTYITENILKYRVVVMNSDSDKNIVDYNSATNPAALFTIAIGGNIVSRGVTFNNLLSMFFTRDVKHKIQQDTYVQRARMFGSRGAYISNFNLYIPEKLYLDWHRCFVFHKLALLSIKTGKGAPVWLEDNRVSAVAAPSIDKTTVSMESGEMGFAVFDYDEHSVKPLLDEKLSNFDKLIKLSKYIGDDALPLFLLNFIKSFLPYGNQSIALHGVRIATNEYSEALDRPRGVLGGDDFKKFPDAIHHILIYRNEAGKARLIYAYKGNIKTLKNRGKK